MLPPHFGKLGLKSPLCRSRRRLERGLGARLQLLARLSDGLLHLSCRLGAQRLRLLQQRVLVARSHTTERLARLLAALRSHLVQRRRALAGCLLGRVELRARRLQRTSCGGLL